MPQNLTPEAIVKIGERVLNIEADAITQMAKEMPQDFAAAAQLILGSTGRVIGGALGNPGTSDAKYRQRWPPQVRHQTFYMRQRQATAIWAWSLLMTCAF